MPSRCAVSSIARGQSGTRHVPRTLVPSLRSRQTSKEFPSMLKALSLSSVLIAFGVLATPSLAAPASGLKGIEANTSSSMTEQVGYRRCWWRHGYRHCRWVGGYDYGPSINLHFGGRHHGHHRGYYRHRY